MMFQRLCIKLTKFLFIYHSNFHQFFRNFIIQFSQNLCYGASPKVSLTDHKLSLFRQDSILANFGSQKFFLPHIPLNKTLCQLFSCHCTNEVASERENLVNEVFFKSKILFQFNEHLLEFFLEAFFSIQI